MKKFFVLLMILAFVFNLNCFATVEEYKRAVELNKENVINRFNLGLAYYKEQMFDDAIEAFKQMLETNKADVDSHKKVDATAVQIIGIIYYNYKNNDDEAIKYFKKAIELNPADADNYYYIGLSYLRKGDTENALQSFKASLSKGIKDTTDVKFRIGQIYYKKNQYSDAIKYFEDVIKEKSDHIEALELLGLIYHKRENSEKAISAFKKVVKAKPDDFNAFYLLGLNYFKQKEYEKMIEAYKKAIEINPNFADAHYNLGMAYYYRNMYEESIDELEKAKQLNPGDAATFSFLAQVKTTAYEYHLSKGTTYLTEENYYKAKNEFELALKIKPGDSEAEKYLNKAIEAIKKEIPVKLEKARNYFNKEKFAEAFAEWNSVIEIDPENSEAKEGLKKIEKNLSDVINAREKIANQLISEGKYAEALNEYVELKKIVPKGKLSVINEKITNLKAKVKTKISSLIKSAEIYLTEKNKNYKKALEKYNEILKYDENNEIALNAITKINAKIDEDKEKYLEMGKQNMQSNKEKAIAYFKKVLDLDPNNKDANKYIQELTGKESKQMADAKQVRNLYYEGVDKYVNGEIEQAIAIWQKVIEIDPNHTEAIKNIKRAKEKLAAIKSLAK